MTTNASTHRQTPSDAVLSATIIGVTELSAFLGVQRSTTHVWGYRGHLPPADYDSINGFKAWTRETVIRWAAETGRLPEWLREEGAPFEPEGGFRRRRRTKAEIEQDAAMAAADETVAPKAAKKAAKKASKKSGSKPAPKAGASLKLVK
jgi:hypothetical protein